jgi:hypothetical protein
MKHVQRFFIAIAMGGLTQSVGAQAFNLDFGGTPLTTPATSYGAASDQTGFWEYGSQLRDISGVLTNATMSLGGSTFSIDAPGASGGDEALMESCFAFGASSAFISLFNVTPGTYDCYIYSWAGALLGPKTVDFRIDNGEANAYGSVNYGSTWPGGHVEGETYTRIRVEVLPQYRVIAVNFGFSGDFNVVNGMQIVPVPAPASALPLLALPLALARRRR